MKSKKIAYFLIALLSFSLFIYSANAASDTTFSFRGAGVTIGLTFPEEAYPNTTITHNITIKANVNLTSINIDIHIYAQVNSTLQLVKSQVLSWGTLHENDSLPTSEIPIMLPEKTNGTLYCDLTVQTEISLTEDYASCSFYTSRISKLTFSEMQSLYNEMLANYTNLQADYKALLSEYDNLLANYSSLLSNYTALLSKHNDLSGKYDAEVSSYESLLTDYDKTNSNYKSKLNEYNTLFADYNFLNFTHYNLQTNFTSLQTVYDELNQTYTSLEAKSNGLLQDITNGENALNSDRIIMSIFVGTVALLIAFIIYIKRKKPEPYVVIRKETVSVKSDYLGLKV